MKAEFNSFRFRNTTLEGFNLTSALEDNAFVV